MNTETLRNFQRESNKIEGIFHEREEEVVALWRLVSAGAVTIEHLIAYVAVIQPDAQFRDSTDAPGVRVGNHIAPRSGPAIRNLMEELLADANDRLMTPYEAHCRYETIHPFTDGNGRSGRALWLQMRKGHAPLGFLHQWYYDALAELPDRH